MKESFQKQCDDFFAFSIKNAGGASSISKILMLMFLGLLLISNLKQVYALPSYARQTGMSCTACHSSFPELTSFGRLFKLNGYTMTGMTTIDEQIDSGQVSKLKLLTNLPLSVMVQTAFTHNVKDIDGVQNNSVAFPQQLSVFYAGQVTPHIGTFIQMTYDGQSIGMDNVDLRYANQTSLGSKSMVYGVTLNNNPTVQDVWNTVPAWRYPYASSEAANSPSKSTILENLGMQVAGIGAYALFNNLVYGEISLYRSAPQGAANPADSTSSMIIKGIAPYWRLALQHQWGDNYFELGTFGIASKLYSAGISGDMDNFNDIAIDFQYERTLSVGTFSLHSSFIKETENRESSGSDNLKLDFNSFKVDGNIYFKNGLGATVGYFSTTGSEDEAIESSNNKPNSDGLVLQLEYLPWYNTKFALQYASYNKFDGSKTNYDGAGRNASNNNTIYLLAWINF